jgi:Tol biopolymer transport system component
MRRTLFIATIALSMLMPFANPGAEAKYPGPNGQILFARNEPPDNDLTPFTINPDGTHEFRVLPGVAAECPRWSPDGSKISVPGATVNADGTGFTPLAPSPDPLLNLGCNTWSPDGSRLAVEGFNDDHPEVTGIYTVRASDGGDLLRVTPVGATPTVVIGDYSPDGNRIVFLGEPAHGRRGSLAVFTVNTDGTGLRQITPGVANCCPGPSWSPDGTELLFGSTRGKLLVVHPDGTGLRQIPIRTGGGLSFAFGPGWSPDGKNIVFSLFLETKGQVDIYTARADGTQLVQVTNTPDNEEFADWGPHPLAT